MADKTGSGDYGRTNDLGVVWSLSGVPHVIAIYSDFIKEASRLYATSLTQALENLDDLVALYALVSRIRLFASEPVVLAAEEFDKQIVAHYGKPNLSVEQIRTAALSAKADPLDVFSFACRKELRNMLPRGTVPAAIGT